MTYAQALYFGLGAVGIAVAITIGFAIFLVVKSRKKHGEK